ncbi:MAG: hypothetical protein IT327_32715 [Anaerolineae bacterium]|nr:hypothetical protein [Anaerolineae bacterium]
MPLLVQNLGTYEYDEAGRLVKTLLPNGVETTETYDEAGRLIRRTHTSTITGILHADYLYELDGLGNHLAVTETIRAPEGGNLETTTIIYGHDSLYRVTQAAYSGVLSGTYTYEYDAVGNRKQFTTNITTTQSISYTYDAANRLLESVDLDSSEVTTYEWDDAGRLITTTVGGNVTRLYSYSQDGDLLQADVEGAITTFVYDGNGNRLQMSVEGTVTTYTLDYAAGSRVLFEEGGAFSDTKHYLYGRECIGEHVDADEPVNEEWRYYQRDANPLAGSGLVRQTSDENRQVTMAWTYSPTGGVVLGEGGPVTNLACGNGGIYDWSTGLIFKNGRYFDPNTGIWITMGAMVTWQIWPQENRRQRRWRKRYGPQIGFLILLLLLILLTTSLSGCACGPVPTPGAPTVPPTLPPFGTPTPGQPGTPTPGQPSPTPQPTPTTTPQPPTPQPPTPIPPTPTNPPTQPPTPTPVSRQPIQLEPWEKQLLTIAAFVEMHGHGDLQAEAIVWEALNRIAGMVPIDGGFFAQNPNIRGESKAASYILNRNQFAIGHEIMEDHNTLKISNNNFEPIEGMTVEAVVTDSYQRYNNFYGGGVDDTHKVTIRAVDDYNNGKEDPTLGAVFYGHFTNPDIIDFQINLLKSNAEARGVADKLTYRLIPSSRPTNPYPLIVNNMDDLPYGK